MIKDGGPLESLILKTNVKLLQFFFNSYAFRNNWCLVINNKKKPVPNCESQEIGKL